MSYDLLTVFFSGETCDTQVSVSLLSVGPVHTFNFASPLVVTSHTFQIKYRFNNKKDNIYTKCDLFFVANSVQIIEISCYKGTNSMMYH